MKFVIYSWWGYSETVAPYAHNSVIEGDIWTIAQDFYVKGLNVMIRHGNDITDYGEPIPVLYICQKGFGQG